MAEDVPNLAESLAVLILKLVKDNVLTHQVILKIPIEIREGMIEYDPFREHFAEELKIFDHEKEIKEKFTEKVKSYLDSYDSSDVIDYLKNLEFSEIVRPWFIRIAILVACGRGNKEREKVSQLLKEMATELKINYAMFSYAFDYCIQNCQDYMLDIPNFTDYLSMFIARAIYDGYFNAMYILHAETYDSNDIEQLKILKSACSYLTLFPMDSHLSGIWGSAISNSELCDRFDDIAHEFHKGATETEVYEKLKELDSRFFYHEFMKRLVMMYATLDSKEEVDYDRVRKLINTLLNHDILSKSQLEVGVKNAKHVVSREHKDDLNVFENLRKLHEHCLSKIRFKYE